MRPSPDGDRGLSVRVLILDIEKCLILSTFDVLFEVPGFKCPGWRDGREREDNVGVRRCVDGGCRERVAIFLAENAPTLPIPHIPRHGLFFVLTIRRNLFHHGGEVEFSHRRHLFLLLFFHAVTTRSIGKAGLATIALDICPAGTGLGPLAFLHEISPGCAAEVFGGYFVYVGGFGTGVRAVIPGSHERCPDGWRWRVSILARGSSTGRLVSRGRSLFQRR
mmetsp:Transcript_29112/g.53197  ORF Transcript_29112/g.53197 Transcript_29112/m.53197 type:complete len:221 (+) Transcript_29112:330-992(+)